MVPGGDHFRPPLGYRRGVSVLSRIRRLSRGQMLDLAVALVILVPAVLAPLAGTGTSSSLPVGVRVALGAVASLALVARRRAPLVVWAVSGVATLALLADHGAPGAAVIASLVALYTVAATTERRLSIGAGVISLIAVTIAEVAQAPSNTSVVKLLFPAVVIVGCWLVGDNLRVRRAYVAELENKAARADADRQAEMAQAAADERARIARELHDVVVHHVSVIAVQAGAARMLSGQQGSAESRAMWSSVEHTARQALSELRQLLGVLRHEHEKEAPALQPQPGLAQIDTLLGDVRRAGLPVELRVEGEPAQLAAGADLSAYRIVQEALTNVMKHEGPVPTRVLLCYRPGELEIDVHNQPAAAKPAPPVDTGPGHGLIGMRERLAVLGGTLEAAGCADGGFRLTARLPHDGD
jgi:signal transduction histidine kinase